MYDRQSSAMGAQRIWVLAADGRRARIFECPTRRGELREIHDLVRPEARLRTRELTSDAPGRSFDGLGAGRHGMDPRHDPKEHNLERFAAEIGELLERGRQEGSFDRLYLVAQPRLLGLLRRTLGETTRKLVAGEVTRGLCDRSPETIRAHLPEFL